MEVFKKVKRTRLWALLRAIGVGILGLLMVFRIIGLILDAGITAYAAVRLAVLGMDIPGLVDIRYGDWANVVWPSLILGFFTLAYVVPLGWRDWGNWRQAGLVQGFFIAFLAEMYGFPLTVYLLGSALHVPLVPALPDPRVPDPHLLVQAMAALGAHPYAALVGALQALCSGLMAVGSALILIGWWQIYRAGGTMVTDGIYRFMRHPQYTGILLVTAAILILWPTIATIIMWPVLVLTYYRLARREERWARETFGEAYCTYATRTPMFLPVPRLFRRSRADHERAQAAGR